MLGLDARTKLYRHMLYGPLRGMNGGLNGNGQLKPAHRRWLKLRPRYMSGIGAAAKLLVVSVFAVVACGLVPLGVLLLLKLMLQNMGWLVVCSWEILVLKLQTSVQHPKL